MPSIKITSEGLCTTIEVDGVPVPGVLAAELEFPGPGILPVLTLDLFSVSNAVALADAELRITVPPLTEAAQQALIDAVAASMSQPARWAAAGRLEP